MTSVPPLISAAMATAVPVLRRRTIHGTDGGRSANFQARGHGLDHLYTHFLQGQSLHIQIYPNKYPININYIIISRYITWINLMVMFTESNALGSSRKWRFPTKNFLDVHTGQQISLGGYYHGNPSTSYQQYPSPATQQLFVLPITEISTVGGVY